MERTAIPMWSSVGLFIGVTPNSERQRRINGAAATMERFIAAAPLILRRFAPQDSETFPASQIQPRELLAQGEFEVDLEHPEQLRDGVEPRVIRAADEGAARRPEGAL